MRSLLSILLFCAPIASAFGQSDPPSSAPDLQPVDQPILRACEGLVQLFEKAPEQVWPGYSPFDRPLVVYRAGRWAILFGGDSHSPGFSDYPKTWPPLHLTARFSSSPASDLAGQLVFDHRVGDAVGIAIGLPDDFGGAPIPAHLTLEDAILGYLAHECFHQYQHAAFGEIPWGHEEKYPITQAENSALAALEMLVLKDALDAHVQGDTRTYEQSVRRFVAVRMSRWQALGEELETYERGLEINEGTAKYVEMRAVDVAGHLKYESVLLPAENGRPALSGLSTTRQLLKEFDDRMTDRAVSPADMPRNRVYPVGAAQCFILTQLGVDWFDKARQAGRAFSYVELMQRHFKVQEKDLAPLLADAKKAHDFETIRGSTERLIAKHREDYQKMLAEFEAQQGRRVEITFAKNGLSRSGSSKGPKLRMEQGQKSLCAEYRVYVLNNQGTRLHLKGMSLLELTDWDAHTLTAVCYVKEGFEWTLDGKPVGNLTSEGIEGKDLSLKGEGITLTCPHRVKMRRVGSRILIDVTNRT